MISRLTILFIALFISSIVNAQDKAKVDTFDTSKYPIIHRLAEIKDHVGKEVILKGHLHAFIPLKDGVPMPMDHWEFHVQFPDRSKVHLRGKIDTASMKVYLNKKVLLHGSVIEGIVNDKENIKGYRLAPISVWPDLEDFEKKKDNYKKPKHVLLDDYPRFKEIISKYEGKVILIDFWASWCKPCIKEIKNSKRLHEDLHDKEIVFLYLGYNDKEKPWMHARKKFDIKGEHVLLDPETIKECKELFRIIGIPWYVVIDKNGNIVKFKAPRPSSPELKKLLLRLLKE